MDADWVQERFVLRARGSLGPVGPVSVGTMAAVAWPTTHLPADSVCLLMHACVVRPRALLYRQAAGQFSNPNPQVALLSLEWLMCVTSERG